MFILQIFSKLRRNIELFSAMPAFDTYDIVFLRKEVPKYLDKDSTSYAFIEIKAFRGYF